MKALSTKVVAGTIALIILVASLFSLAVYFLPELILTNRGLRGMRFSLRGRMMNVAFDAGLMNVARNAGQAMDIREFVVARNGSTEEFWVSGNKYDVQYELNSDINAWTCTGKVDWIIQAKVSCATNLVFKMYSNFDVLPMPVEDLCAATKYERFILGMGGLSAFETECDNVLKNGLCNIPLDHIPVPPKFAALGVQGLKLVHDNGTSFLIVYLDNGKSSGFIRLLEDNSHIKLGEDFKNTRAIRLDENIWWFGDVKVTCDADEAYSILHGGNMMEPRMSSFGAKCD